MQTLLTDNGKTNTVSTALLVALCTRRAGVAGGCKVVSGRAASLSCLQGYVPRERARTRTDQTILSSRFVTWYKREEQYGVACPVQASWPHQRLKAAWAVPEPGKAGHNIMGNRLKDAAGWHTDGAEAVAWPDLATGRRGHWGSGVLATNLICRGRSQLVRTPACVLVDEDGTFAVLEQ